MYSHFAYVVVAILILQVFVLALNAPVARRVKAGDKDDYHFRFGLKNFTKRYVNDAGTIVDVSNMPCYVVAGKSMSEYNVMDGQTVIIEPMSQTNALNITDYPILLYRLEKQESTKPLDSSVKLRKFVGYIKDINASADKVYNEFRDRIKIDRDVFESEYSQRREKIASETSSRTQHFILSETFSEKLGRRHYSIHLANHVEGKVKYVI